MIIEDENLNKLIKAIYDEVEFKFIEEEADKEHRLTNESPAILERDEIYILKTLTYEEKIEAIAHELGHILLRNKKLIGVTIDNSDQLDFFAVMLNNLISHKELIEVLKKEFNIDSNIHLKLQKKALLSKTIENRIHNTVNTDELYGLGFQLYDMCRTTGETYNTEIEELIESNEHIKKSIETAQKYLNDIDSNMNEEEQINRVIYIFKELGMLGLITSLDCVAVYMKENITELVKGKVDELIRRNINFK